MVLVDMFVTPIRGFDSFLSKFLGYNFYCLPKTAMALFFDVSSTFGGGTPPILFSLSSCFQPFKWVAAFWLAQKILGSPSCLANLLAVFLTFFLTFFPAFFLAFYLASDILSGILTFYLTDIFLNILSGILSDIVSNFLWGIWHSIWQPWWQYMFWRSISQSWWQMVTICSWWPKYFFPQVHVYRPISLGKQGGGCQAHSLVDPTAK